jgi:predicted MFS family arabinose efflux permease
MYKTNWFHIFIGFVVGGVLPILLVAISNVTTKMPPGQQDSMAIANGAVLALGIPAGALIGGLVVWVIQEYRR